MDSIHPQELLDEASTLSFDTSIVKPGQRGPARMSKYWPYKLASLLIYGEIPGVKRLPGHIVLAPMPILHRICPDTYPRLKGHLNMAVDLGLFQSVEYHYSTVIVQVAQTPWETGTVDVVAVGRSVPTHPPRERKPSRAQILRAAEAVDLPVLHGDYLEELRKGPPAKGDSDE